MDTIIISNEELGISNDARVVMLNNANVAIKPSAEQVHLLCRGGARSRNSSIPALAMLYVRSLLSASRRFFVTLRMTLRFGIPKVDNSQYFRPMLLQI